MTSATKEKKRVSLVIGKDPAIDTLTIFVFTPEILKSAGLSNIATKHLTSDSLCISQGAKYYYQGSKLYWFKKSSSRKYCFGKQEKI